MKRTPDVIVVQQPAHTEYVTRKVNVHEHRAPTDESIKVLREMEEKALEQVLKGFISRAGDNVLGAVTWQRSFMDDDAQFAFTLNGELIRGKVEDRPEIKQEWLEAAAKAIAWEISVAILKKSMLQFKAMR